MAELLKNAKPELLREWFSERNAALSLEVVKVNASDRAWWKCINDSEHIWSARVRNRAIDGNGCPYCSGRLTLRKDSLGHLYPKIAGEFHPARNPGIDPFAIAPGSNKSVWWICAKGHVWKGQIARRVSTGSGCRKCSYSLGKRTLADVSLGREFHPTRNGTLTPDLLTLGSRKRVWWQCAVEPSHEWKESIAYRFKSQNTCPACRPRASGRQLTLDKFSEELSREWHHELNGILKPADVTIGTSRRVWWQCSQNPEHVWQAIVRNRTLGKQGCPKCYDRAFDESRSLAVMFPKLAAEWHSERNGNLTPLQVTFGSSRKVWWRCLINPSHEWERVINVRTKRNSPCPLCSGNAVTPERSLAGCFPGIAAEWHPNKNGALTPAKVKAKSGKKVWWQCASNPLHEWMAQVKNRTINGSGCPECARERNVFQIQRELNKSAFNTTDVFRTFLFSLRSLENLSKAPPAKPALRTLFFRMLYAQTITALEAYLADSFLGLVVAKHEFKKRLLTEVNEFKERRFSFAEILVMNPSGDDSIAEMLSEVSWHNIAKARALYSAVFGINFGGDLAPLFKAVTNRHDIVHRNGRTIAGRMTPIGEAELTTLIAQVREFVRSVDSKLTELHRR